MNRWPWRMYDMSLILVLVVVPCSSFSEVVEESNNDERELEHSDLQVVTLGTCIM